MIKKATYVSGVTPASAPFTWFFERFIAPPTSCPRLRATIQNARYFPRAPEGASDIIVPLSATYQQPVPMPEMKPPKMMYYVELVLSWYRVGEVDAYPLVTELAVAVVRRTLDWERHGADNQGPLDTKFVYERSTKEADQCEHNVVDTIGNIVCLCRGKTTTTETCR